MSSSLVSAWQAGGPNGLARGWALDQCQAKERMRRQQVGGVIMFWAEIKGRTLIGPYKGPEGLNINSKAYYELLDRFLLT